MVSADALCVALPPSSLLQHQHHENSSSSDDAPPAAAPPTAPRKAISNIRDISSRYLSPATPPPRRASSAYISSFSSVARRFPSPPKDRTLHQYQVPSYAIPPPPSSSRRPSSSVERRRSTSSRDIAPALSSPVDAVAHASKRSDHLQPRPSTRSSSWQPEPCSPRLHIPVKTRLEGRGGRSPIYLATSDHSPEFSGNPGHRSSLISPRQVLSDRKRSPSRHRSFHQAENSRPPENLNRKQELLQYCLRSSSRLYGTSVSKSVDLGGGREDKVTSALLQSKCLTPVSRVLRPTAPNFESFSQSINIEGTSSSVLRLTVHTRLNLETKLRSKESPIKARQKAVTTHTPEKSIGPLHEELDDESSQPVFTKTASNVYRSRYRDGVATKATQIRASTPTRLIGDTMSRARSIHDQALLKLGQGFIPASPLSGMPQYAHKGLHRSLSPAKSHPNFLAKSCPSPRSSMSSSLACDLSGSRSMGAAVSVPTSGAPRHRGKKGLTQGEAAFLYRTLHNRYLQWRFVNAQADLMSNTQKLTGEKLLYSVWVKTTKLQESLTAKRLKLQQARHAYKLSSILRSQGSKLQDWLNVHQAHSNAVRGIVEALDAAMLRLPVDGGVKADSWAVGEAMASAVDVMHTVEYSANILIQRIQKANRLISELALMVEEERALMEECSYLLLQLSSLEVQECSLRMHLIQSRRERVRVLGHLMESSAISVM